MRSQGWNPNPIGGVVLREGEKELAPHLYALRKSHIKTQKKVAGCKPERELLPEPNHAGSLITVFQPLEL